MFLYHTPLSNIATVSVTHNTGCIQSPFANNLALHVEDFSAQVIERRKTLETELNKPIQWLNQVHGKTVYIASGEDSNTPTADAAMTQSQSIVLAVMTADCLPVVISAQNTQGEIAVGIAHAGWRGLLNGVLDETIHALNQVVSHAQLHAHFAPCIGTAQFEVGAQVRDAFIAKNHATSQNFYPTLQKTFLCDLTGLARETLHRYHVHSITGGGWCTVSDPRLASYRRQSVTGRFATLVTLN